MSSRIEQIIEEIEEYVESCKYQPLSTTKIVVNKEELEELLRELRLKTPDEIKRYQKIISNKDAILADAQNKADAIIAEGMESGGHIGQNRQMRPSTMQTSRHRKSWMLQPTMPTASVSVPLDIPMICLPT